MFLGKRNLSLALGQSLMSDVFADVRCCLAGVHPALRFVHKPARTRSFEKQIAFKLFAAPRL
jgi:hypothetical protein